MLSNAPVPETPSPAGCRAAYQNGVLALAAPGLECAWAINAAGAGLLSWRHNTRELLTAAAPAAPLAASLQTFTAPLTACGDAALHAVVDFPAARYHFALTAAVPAVTWEVSRTAPTAAPAPGDGAAPNDNGPTGLEVDPAAGVPAGDAAQNGVGWAFASPHLRLRVFNFSDQTDNHDNLLRVDEYRLSPCEALRLPGVLFAVEDAAPGAGGGGIAFLKLAPQPHARPEKEAYDWEWDKNLVRLHGENYPWAAIAYQGGMAGLTAALQRYQHALRPPVAGRDGLAISNTWGDRHRDAALNEKFVRGEIAVAAEIGIDACQIDDGWQQGVTSNSSVAARQGGGVWEGYHAADPHFWAVHGERFPHGLEPLTAAAAAAGVGLGLWFSPDSAHDFANWEKDAATIRALGEKYGVQRIKIDGVKSRTRTGEANLRRFFQTCARDGWPVFDLDITAETRPGYFGMPEFGPLFVENRYSDWHRWWPYATFRNLWQLAAAIPPVRLRMEILNPDRNRELYNGDPLAPEHYGMDWLFCSVMVSSPLLWCELSSLAPARRKELQKIIPAWKKYRAELHQGVVLPLGGCPDGTALAGFWAHGAAADHLILLRDCGTDAAFPAPAALAGRAAETLAGAGVWEAATARAQLPEKRSYLWLRFPYKA